jgi:SPASM domain peptide maturase of grasp-with-spasm system
VDNFSVDKDLFMETHFHNVCLNRKLCIDHKGNIKNCLSMDQIFGNIFEDDVEQIVNSPDFQKLWHIKKDEIDVCKDCEFRYICTDCRCFIKDSNNIYSQPAKCGYNPYIAKWQNEDGYVPVEECGKYSKETGFVPDDKKIKELNNKIWGEDE